MSEVSIDLKPGDIFLTKGNSLVSKLIRFFSRTGGESRTMVNHAGIVVGAGNEITAATVEALTTVKRRTMSVYANSEKTETAIYRPINVSDEDLAKIVAKAETYVGRGYGWFKLVAHLIDYFLGGRYVARRLTNSDNYPICSWVVASSYAEVGLDFRVAPGAASPDDIWDFVTTNPDKYEVVHELGLIKE